MEDSQIIDAIEAKNYQYAQSLIKLKISKYPKSSYFQCLQVYLLHHQNNKEVLLKANELLNQYPSDLRTTNLLFKIFNERGKDKEAAAVYENLVKRLPNNCEENLIQWFFNSLNINDVKGIQKASMNLSKRDNRKYKLWAGLGCYLLSNEVDEKQFKLFRTLGSRIMPQPETTHELFIASLLLDDESIPVIEKFMESTPLDLDIKLIYLDLLEKQEMFDKLYDYTNKLLFKENFNDFNTWKKFIKASKNTGKEYEGIEKVILSVPPSRNSKLSLIELSKTYGINEKKYIQEYYQDFKTKLCCASDLQLVDVDIESVAEDITVQNLNHTMNNFRITGDGDCWDIYKKFLTLSSNKPDTDFYIPNELIITEVMNNVQREKTTANIIRAIITLRKLTTHDPLDFRLQLSLIKLYSLVNMNSLMMSTFDMLKIRMMQIDSLGHYVTDRLSYLTPCKANLNFLVQHFRFYLTCESDISENFQRAFNEGIYNKIPSFLKFQHKLKHSFEYYNILLNIWQTIRITGDKSYESYFKNKVINAKIDIIIDNRDTSFLNDGFHPITTIEKLQLEFAKEQYLIDGNETNFKKFNKLLESTKLSPFDTWLFKLYSSLFKFKSKPNEKESLKNYLIKNVKLTKVVLPNPLSSDFNYVYINVGDFCKLAMVMANDKEITMAAKKLVSDLKSNQWRDDQKQQMKEIKDDLINSDWQLDIDNAFINDTMDILNDSLTKSCYINVGPKM